MSLPFLQPYFGLSNSLQTAQASGAGTTRGVFGGGDTGVLTNIIDYITIATLGNATDFGDLSVTRQVAGSCNSNTRGCFGGGVTMSNVIDYITIATPGNATDFGDLTAAREYLGGCQNGL